MAEYKIEKKKIIFNADFKPSVDFFQKQYDIIKELNADFPGWDLSGLNFVIQDKENNCSGSFSSQKVVYEVEEANNKIDFAKERILKGLRIYSNYLPLKVFIRLGIRFYMFVPMQEIKKEELADIIQSKLFITNEAIINIFTEKANDLAYILDYAKDGFLYHLKCGPMPKEHIPTWVAFGEGKNRFKSAKDFKDYLESFPEMSIFIDIDCYKNDVSFKDMESFLNKAFDNCLQTSAKLKKYILGE